MKTRAMMIIISNSVTVPVAAPNGSIPFVNSIVDVDIEVPKTPSMHTHIIDL